MVFFTSLLIVVILYYLQGSGLIYVTIIAVIAELINLFMAQTMTATAKNNIVKKYDKIVFDYKKIINRQTKTIKQLKNIRDDSVQKLYKANQAIKHYEEQLGIEDSAAIEIPKNKVRKPEPASPQTPPEKEKNSNEFVDLPDGSNKKGLPI